jgi:hypothetical protein
MSNAPLQAGFTIYQQACFTVRLGNGFINVFHYSASFGDQSGGRFFRGYPNPDHWLNRKNCFVLEMGLVTVFCPLTTTGAGELVVQTPESRFVVDCKVNPA